MGSPLLAPRVGQWLARELVLCLGVPLFLSLAGRPEFLAVYLRAPGSRLLGYAACRGGMVCLRLAIGGLGFGSGGNDA